MTVFDLHPGSTSHLPRSTTGSVWLLAERSRLDRPGHLVPEVLRGLRESGLTVHVLDPATEPVSVTTPSPRLPDLVVLMSGSEPALSLAGSLEARGAVLFTPYSVSAACRDKVVQTTVLAGAGLPVPDSWVTADPLTMRDRLREGPLLFKDPRGSRGRGLHLVTRRDELDLVPRGTTWLVMRYHPAEGPDLKLYRIGDEVFGVVRKFPAETPAEKRGRPLVVDDRLRALAMGCADAFGVTVCGVDVIRSGGRLWVVDMSSFPGFKGVPDAPARIAREVQLRLPAAVRSRRGPA